jgi:hypothetical protein
MFRSARLFVVVLIVLVFASTAFAFAASNTMPAPSFAGEGSTVTSGYTVTNVVYTLNATNPSNIDSVKFDLDNAATTVKVQLVSTGSYYTCTVAGSTWTCATTAPQVTVAAADQLHIIAIK